MTSDKLILLGGGALARVLVDLCGREAFAATYVEPAFDSAPIAGLPVLRDWASARARGQRFVVAVGDIALRRRLQQDALAAGLQPCAPLVSPHAVLAGDVQLGPGCVIGPMCTLAPGVQLQAHVLLMPAVVLGHDVSVGENCVLTAGTVMGGGSGLERDCFIGLNATIVPRVRLAAGCVVGAAALCLRDVLQASVLVGNPARAQPREPREIGGAGGAGGAG